MYRSLSILTVLIIISTVPLVSSEVMRGEFTVPDWVKNTAGWWASEQIPDSAFLQGIQFLIKEGIMIVEISTEIDSEAAEEIPGWVKNTAGWWADGEIHDITFAAAIKYLVSKSIIVVTQAEQIDDAIEQSDPSIEQNIEIRDFYIKINGSNCCENWSYVGKEYRFQIETFDERNGNYIDGVEINVKVISEYDEVLDSFVVTTEGGVYKNSIHIHNMDWYGENTLSVTGKYYGTEKTTEILSNRNMLWRNTLFRKIH